MQRENNQENNVILGLIMVLMSWNTDSVVFRSVELIFRFDPTPKISNYLRPWPAPDWMKTNNAFNCRGYLYKKYYQTWANYFVRFFDEYARTIYVLGV